MCQTNEYTAYKRASTSKATEQTDGGKCRQTLAVQAAKTEQLKQQRQQCLRQPQLNNDLIFNLRISRELKFIQFVCTVRNNPNRIGKTASKFEKEILKIIGRLIVHLLDYAGCDYCLHCCFVNNGKEMDKELKRTVDTAIVLVCCCRESFLTPAFSAHSPR